MILIGIYKKAPVIFLYSVVFTDLENRGPMWFTRYNMKHTSNEYKYNS